MTKFRLQECLRVGNLSIAHGSHIFYFHFMEASQLFPDFKNFLHVPIWALFILYAHPFSGIYLP